MAITDESRAQLVAMCRGVAPPSLTTFTSAPDSRQDFTCSAVLAEKNDQVPHPVQSSWPSAGADKRRTRAVVTRNCLIVHLRGSTAPKHTVCPALRESRSAHSAPSHTGSFSVFTVDRLTGVKISRDCQIM